MVIICLLTLLSALPAVKIGYVSIGLCTAFVVFILSLLTERILTKKFTYMPIFLMQGLIVVASITFTGMIIFP